MVLTFVLSQCFIVKLLTKPILLRILNTDEALKLYNETHEAIPLNRPNFSDYYKPSSYQKIGEIAYVGGGMLAIGYLASKFI